MMGEKTNPPGRLFVISAPSGAGKSTLCGALLEKYGDMLYSISHTTRKPRGNEQNGVDYHFIDEKEFFDGIEKGKWAEWAKVHGNYYGTSAEFIDRKLGEGLDILLDIDVQGAEQIVKRYPDGITIFIMPPSLETIRERMSKRNTDTKEVIERRVKNAVREMAQKDRYRHIVVNDRLEDAVAELVSLVGGYRTQVQDGI